MSRFWQFFKKFGVLVISTFGHTFCDGIANSGKSYWHTQCNDRLLFLIFYVYHSYSRCLVRINSLDGVPPEATILGQPITETIKICRVAVNDDGAASKTTAATTATTGPRNSEAQSPNKNRLTVWADATATTATTATTTTTTTAPTTARFWDPGLRLFGRQWNQGSNAKTFFVLTFKIMIICFCIAIKPDG